MKTPKIKQLVAGKCNGCDCRSKEPQCPKCLQFGFGGAAMISVMASKARWKRSVQRMARRLGVKLQFGSPGRRFGYHLCITAQSGPEHDGAPTWEMVAWEPNWTSKDLEGHWERQMFDGDVVAWMQLPALPKSPSGRMSSGGAA